MGDESSDALIYTSGKLRIKIPQVRKLEKGKTFRIKIRFEGIEKRTEVATCGSKRVSFNEEFDFDGSLNSAIKIALIEVSDKGSNSSVNIREEKKEKPEADSETLLTSREKNSERLIGRLELFAQDFHEKYKSDSIKDAKNESEENGHSRHANGIDRQIEKGVVKIKHPISSDIYPDAVIHIEGSFKSGGKENNPSTVFERPIAKYAMLEDLLLSPDLVLVEAITKTTTILDLDDVASALVQIFAWNSQGMDLVKWAAKRELDLTESEEVLFRGQTVNTKMMSGFANLIGKDYLQQILAPIILEMNDSIESGSSFEVDPSRIGNVKNNRANLIKYTTKLLNRIINSNEILPKAIIEICCHLAEIVSKKYPKSINVAIGGYLFLRYICPSLVTPESYGIVEIPISPSLRRGLVLCAKLLQNLASGVTFGEKESYMSAFNSIFIEKEMENINKYFQSIIKYKDTKGGSEEMAPSATQFAQSHQFHIIHNYIYNHRDKMEKCLEEIEAKKSSTSAQDNFTSPLLTSRSKTSVKLQLGQILDYMGQPQTPSITPRSIRARGRSKSAPSATNEEGIVSLESSNQTSHPKPVPKKTRSSKRLSIGPSHSSREKDEDSVSLTKCDSLPPSSSSAAPSSSSAPSRSADKGKRRSFLDRFLNKKK